MRNFFDLVGFEYKKIFKRKGAVIAIAIVTFLTIATPMSVFFMNTYIEGDVFENQYDATIKNRDYARALSGRYIDATLISETKEAFAKVQPDGDRGFINGNEIYESTPGYQEYGRPYNQIYNFLYSVYGGNFRLLQNLTQEQIENFYQIRHDKMSGNINLMGIGDTAKEKLIQLDSKIQTPFTFDWVAGYERFMSLMYITGVLAVFVIGICLAPMFSSEYGTRTDQLILSSRFGKNKIIMAKLFTGISFSTGLCLFLTLLTYLICTGIYGFDGAFVPVQLPFPFIIYPMTTLQGAIACSICGLFAVIMVGGITLFLSSVFKSPFGVIIIISLLIFVPMMIFVPESNVLLHNLFRLLPANMVWISMSLINYLPYELFGLMIPPYIFMPVFAALVTAILSPFAYRSFKNHQIG